MPPRSTQRQLSSATKMYGRGGKQFGPSQRVGTRTEGDLQWMQIMQTTMEKNNQMMMENMRNIITSHFSNPSG